MSTFIKSIPSRLCNVVRPERTPSPTPPTLESGTPSSLTVSPQASKCRSILFATLSLLLQSAYLLAGLAVSALHLDPHRIFYIVSSVLVPLTFWGMHITHGWSARKSAGRNMPYILWIVFAAFNFSAFVVWAGIACSPLRGEQQAFDVGFVAVAASFFAITLVVYVVVVVKLVSGRAAESDRSGADGQPPAGQTKKVVEKA